MYRSFKVQNFRGLRNLQIDSLERINLIAGKNNAGKTAFLEALFLHTGSNIPRLSLAVNDFRGVPNNNMREAFHDLFWNFDSDAEIVLDGSGHWMTGNAQTLGERRLRISLDDIDYQQDEYDDDEVIRTEQAIGIVPSSVGSANKRLLFSYTDEYGDTYESDGWLAGSTIAPGLQQIALRTRQAKIDNRTRAIFIPSRLESNPQEDAERFGRLMITRQHRKIEEIMRRVEPRLQGLSVVILAGVPTIYAEMEDQDRLLPLRLMGDGMIRLLALSLVISDNEGGVVLVDEIENGLHHSVVKRVWSGIAQFAREFDVQIFATTHSRECIRAAHQAFSEDELYDFRLHRLERIKDSDDTRAVTYSKKTLEIALKKDLEVR